MKKLIILLSLLLALGLWAETIVISDYQNQVRLMNSAQSSSRLEMTLGSFEFDEVTIDGQVWYLPHIKKAGLTLEAGYPQVPVLAGSVIIPATAKMELSIVESEYVELHMPIAPSKGNLTRDINPETVPFAFSELYSSDASYPLEHTYITEPFIIRDYRGITVRFQPFVYYPAQNITRIYTRLVVDVQQNGTDLTNSFSTPKTSYAPEFRGIYENMFLNFGDAKYPSLDEEGRILVIKNSMFDAAIIPWVDWKRQMGHTVDVVDVSVAGPTANQIKTFIQNQYDLNNGLKYVQIMGDAPQVPSLSSGGGGSDPSYALLAGGDSYPDIYVGRFSAQTVAEMNTQILRSVHYERDIQEGSMWLHNAMGIASNEGGGSQGDMGESDQQHMELIRTDLLGYGYTTVDQMYQTMGATAAQVSTHVNSGRGFINYVGHGSDTSWVTTGFNNNNVNALTNDYMLPFIVSVACVNGNFVSQTCFAEAWLRATNNSNGNPTGAIAMYASTINQGWNPPMRGQDEITDLLIAEQKQTIGGLFFNGSSKMIEVYGTSGISEYKCWTIFGDASLMVRTKNPTLMTAQYNPVLLIGMSNLLVQTEANARLTLSQNNVIYGNAVADAGGTALINLDILPTEPMDLTLTIAAHNKVTLTATVSMVTTDILNPAQIVSPLNEATLVSPYTTINWRSGGGVPTGYRLSFGTNNPPTNIVNNLDMLAATSYTPDPELNYDTTYYWQIVPYNANGSAANCPVWSFTTHGDASVDALPYTQNWDAVTAPDLPFDWTAIVNSTATAAYVRTNTTTSNSAPNNIQMTNSTDANAQLLLVSPEISQTILMNSVRVKAWVRPIGSTYTLDVGVLTNPMDPATFELVQTLTFTATTWAEHAIPLSAYTGTGRFIAFRHGLGGTSRTIYIDDITFEAIAPNDLAAVSIAGNTTPSVGTPSNYTVQVFNNGTATQNTYTVKLLTAAGAELASVAGPSIAAGITIPVQIAWTPTTEGPMAIKGKVVLAGDVNALDDETAPINISVQPEGVNSVTIGEGDQLQGVPWEFFYKSSLFQTLYYSTEMGMFGNITAISFYNNFTTNLPAMPVKLWLGTTMLEDLSAGWADPTLLTLVYDGNLDFPSGANTITVPLQVPFTYTGGNLVLYAKRPLDTVYYASADDFLAQTVGTNRARKLQSDSIDYDPMAPEAAGTLSGTFPKATFIMTPLSPNPMFIVNPPQKDFDMVLLGQNAQQTFHIANAGGGTLGVNSISISGNAAFTLSNLPTLPQSLATGQVTTFTVSYTPQAEGDHTAVVTIVDDITRETHTVQLSGEGFDATVYNLPLNENWDQAAVPSFPLGWSTILNSTSTTSYLRTSTTSPYSAPSCVQFSNSDDANADVILISPLIDDDIDMTSIRVKLMAKGGTNFELQIGTIVEVTDPGSFELAETLPVIANWNEYVVNLTTHIGTGRYIAVRHGLGGTSRTIYIDDIAFEEIAPTDLAAVSITGNPTPSVGVNTNYEVTVFNNGTAAQDTYQIQIVDGQGTVLASAPGTLIEPGESLSTSLTITLATEGPMSIHGKVILPGDVNSVNDLSSPLNLVVMSADIVMITIGEGNLNQGVPFEFYNRNSIFETIYLQSELDLYGTITNLTFYNNFVTNLEDKPIKIWLGTTNLENLSGGWILPSELTLVYDGTMDFPSGQNVISIPLQTPFTYLTGNLVMMAYRPMDTANFNTNDNFLAQTVGTNRARKLVSNTVEYDPTAPSGAGTLSGTFPRTSIGFDLDGMGSLSGVVTSSGSPLEAVQISINDTPLVTTTSASGQYSFPYLLEGNYTLAAHKVGYEDQSLPFTIVDGANTELNISMVASTTVIVSGIVVGSDNPTAGLDEATVSLSGVLNYSGTTNAMGQFTIPNVLSGNTYNYTIMRAGYQNLTGTINVASTNYDMGTITLNELTLPPVAVTAALNTAETAVNLTWRAPGQPGGGLFFDFEANNDGGWEPSSTWTDPNGDWEYTADYDVTEWNPVYTGTSVVPPPTAYSGTGMWGTKINTNYTNSGGFSYLSKTFNFSGISNAHMRFYSWENLFGNFDYAQVSVNGTLVWGPSWDYQGTVWQERIIDLSAFDSMPEVEIRFEMWATTTVNYAGWYIDDVEIGSGDNFVRTSPSPQMPIAFQGLSELEAAALAETIEPARSQAQRMALNTPAASRIPVGYLVYKLMQGQEQQENLWTQLTTAAITDTAYAAPGWQALPNGEHKWAVKAVYTAGVLSNPAFSNMLRIWPNDLSALTISGNTTPTVSAPSTYVVRIKNTGTAAQAAGAYTVKIFSGTNELASVAGPAIAVNQELDVSVVWTPTTAGTIQIHGKVVLPDDLTPDNDTTANMNVLVMPAGQFGYTVGEGDQLARVPMDMYYKCSLFQSLYYPAELGNFMGFLQGIQFYNNFVTDLQTMPTKVYIGTTTMTDLTTDWIPVDASHTLVFDGSIDYPAGENVITIPFNTPYMYLNGENLVVTVLRPMDTVYYNTNDRFEAQTVGTDRARKAFSDTITFDPAAPPAPTATQLSGQFPMTNFLGIPSGIGHIGGTVTVDGVPLPNVSIHITEIGFSTVTDANGVYSFQNAPVGINTVIAAKHGYAPVSHTIVIVEDQTTTLDISLAPLPLVRVSGRILGSDTGSAIANATFSLSGYHDYQATTNSFGQFSINDVYGASTYTYSIVAVGYDLFTGEVNVGTNNVLMGNIIINESCYPPQNVVAMPSPDEQYVSISWDAPSARERGARDELSKANRALTGYRVYRFPISAITQPQTWTEVSSGTVQGLSFNDMAWTMLAEGDYAWAVRAIYTGGLISEPTISNTLYRGFLEPAAPQYLELAVQGNLITLSWESVSTDIHGNPLEADYYLIYMLDSPHEEPSPYHLIDITEQSISAFEMAGTLPQMLFFRIVAVKDEAGYSKALPQLQQSRYKYQIRRKE